MRQTGNRMKVKFKNDILGDMGFRNIRTKMTGLRSNSNLGYIAVGGMSTVIIVIELTTKGVL